MKICLLIVVTALSMLLFVGCATKNQTSKADEKLYAVPEWDSLEELKSKIDGGQNVNSRDFAGQSVLMYASVSDDLEAVKYLIDNGANVNARNMVGATALFYACGANRIAVMEYLLEHGAAIDAISDVSETALFWATKFGRMEAVSLLLRNNATTKIRDWEGKTVLDVAKEHNWKEIEFIILEAIEKEGIQIAKEGIQIAEAEKEAEKEAIQKEFRISQKNGKQELLTFIKKYPNSELVNEGQRSIVRIDEITKSMKSKEIYKKLEIGKTVVQLKGIIGDPQFSGPRMSNTTSDGGVGILHVVGTQGTWLYCEDYPKDLPYCGVVNIIANQKGVVTEVSTGAAFHAH